jgi:hypothetical protein
LLKDDLPAALRRIPWRDDPTGFAAWAEGRTGYPVVDAAMRRLNASGWMHNRARMAAQEISSTPVTVFDSQQLSLGTGFLVETAAKMAAAGSSVTANLAPSACARGSAP